MTDARRRTACKAIAEDAKTDDTYGPSASEQGQ